MLERHIQHVPGRARIDLQGPGWAGVDAVAADDARRFQRVAPSAESKPNIETTPLPSDDPVVRACANTSVAVYAQLGVGPDVATRNLRVFERRSLFQRLATRRRLNPQTPSQTCHLALSDTRAVLGEDHLHEMTANVHEIGRIRTHNHALTHRRRACGNGPPLPFDTNQAEPTYAPRWEPGNVAQGWEIAPLSPNSLQN